MNILNNNPQPAVRKNHAFSQFEDAKETQKVRENPDKTAPDEQVDKPVAKPEQKPGKHGENTPSKESVPSPKTKIGFKTPSEQK